MACGVPPWAPHSKIHARRMFSTARPKNRNRSKIINRFPQCFRGRCPSGSNQTCEEKTPFLLSPCSEGAVAVSYVGCFQNDPDSLKLQLCFRSTSRFGQAQCTFGWYEREEQRSGWQRLALKGHECKVHGSIFGRISARTWLAPCSPRV